MKFSHLKSATSHLEPKTVVLNFEEGGEAEFSASDLPVLIAGLASGVAVIEAEGGANFTALKVSEFTLAVSDHRQVFMSFTVAGARVPLHVPAALLPDLIKALQQTMKTIKVN